MKILKNMCLCAPCAHQFQTLVILHKVKDTLNLNPSDSYQVSKLILQSLREETLRDLAK